MPEYRAGSVQHGGLLLHGFCLADELMISLAAQFSATSLMRTIALIDLITCFLAPELLLVHFLCQENVLTLSPETDLALLQALGSRAAGGLQRQARCSCQELLSSLALTQAWLSPRHFPTRLLTPGPSAESAGLSSCPFDAFRVTTWPKLGTATVAFVSSQMVWEGPCTSAVSPAVFCSTLSLVSLPAHSLQLDLPGCGDAAAQTTLDSHCS